eukprot:1081869-Amphidinium_carterae.1
MRRDSALQERRRLHLADHQQSTLQDRLQRVRRLLQERVTQLTEENIRVPIDIFVTRLASSGVPRGSLLWRSDVMLAEVTAEAGL